MTQRMNEDMLVHQARAVLDFNWTGEYTMPGPRLYPHQWSWDAAFIAIGYSHYDQERATRGLRHLFEAQWKNGLLPQLVFNPHFTNVTSAKLDPPPKVLHTASTHLKAVVVRSASSRTSRLGRSIVPSCGSGGPPHNSDRLYATVSGHEKHESPIDEKACGHGSQHVRA